MLVVWSCHRANTTRRVLLDSNIGPGTGGRILPMPLWYQQTLCLTCTTWSWPLPPEITKPDKDGDALRYRGIAIKNPVHQRITFGDV